MGKPMPLDVEANHEPAASSSSAAPTTIQQPIPSHAQIAQSVHASSQRHIITPKTFRASINSKLDNPHVSLFRLSIRVLQFVFALTSGICYAAELSSSRIEHKTNFIYAQVTMGLTLIVLIADSLTIRSYQFTWMLEWLLAVLWFALFGVFYSTYYGKSIEAQYVGADVGRMKGAVWVDLVNALLWSGSAVFSSFMCCTGMRAAIRGKLERRRQRKGKAKMMEHVNEMEMGTVRISPEREETLPGYEEVETRRL